MLATLESPSNLLGTLLTPLQTPPASVWLLELFLLWEDISTRHWSSVWLNSTAALGAATLAQFLSVLLLPETNHKHIQQSRWPAVGTMDRILDQTGGDACRH